MCDYVVEKPSNVTDDRIAEMHGAVTSTQPAFADLVSLRGMCVSLSARSIQEPDRALDVPN